MNPEIYELFEAIDAHKEHMEQLLRRKELDAETKSRIFVDMGAIESFNMQIQEISATLNPGIPEPYASMSADEIIKGLGVYR